MTLKLLDIGRDTRHFKFTVSIHDIPIGNPISMGSAANIFSSVQYRVTVFVFGHFSDSW